jgi:hypothetical protein
MAKELPYFKFFCSEWSDGDITLEDYNLQGFFINICAYYWSNECFLSLEKLKKRFRQDAELIDLLIKNNLIKVKKENVNISFLDEQKEERKLNSKSKSKAGIASAEAKRLTRLQQEVNTASTENQHMLNLCSTESQLLREEKKREEKKREENIINNTNFSNECKLSEQWIEIIAIQTKLKKEIIILYLENFEKHLIAMQEQKKTTKEFKEHFTHWIKKQNFSDFTEKTIGKTNQL